MKDFRRSHAVSSAFIFLLLGLFCILSALLVLFGVRAYQHTAGLMTSHNTSRILQAYVRSAVRSDDMADAFSVSTIDGIPVLSIQETEEECVRFIYYHEGFLKELYLSAEDAFAPELGETLCPLSGFSASLSGRLLSICLTDTDGETYAADIALRSGTGGDAL